MKAFRQDMVHLARRAVCAVFNALLSGPNPSSCGSQLG